MKLVIGLVLFCATAFAQIEKPATPADGDVVGAIKTARVFFIEPKDGATVKRTFKVKMGVEGIKIRPAGEAPDEVTSGHHHLLINTKPLPPGVPVPADEKHIHFGKGETETTVTLPPGEHTLTLQFADGAHRAFAKEMFHTIKVKVR
jgi:hypothetical protein